MSVKQHRHFAVVVTTHRLRDGLRKRYWVRCWYCELELGPFVDRAKAFEERETVTRLSRWLG